MEGCQAAHVQHTAPQSHVAQQLCPLCGTLADKNHICPVAWPQMYCKPQSNYYVGSGNYPSEDISNRPNALSSAAAGTDQNTHIDSRPRQHMPLQNVPMAMATVAPYQGQQAMFGLGGGTPPSYMSGRDSGEGDLDFPPGVMQDHMDLKMGALLVHAVQRYNNGELMMSDMGYGMACRPEKVRRQWSPAEDQMLMDAVARYGDQRWSYIAHLVPGRMGKQCRERWINHLRPGIKHQAGPARDHWTEEEDRLIAEGVRELGTRWAEIARRLPGRSDNAIKNRYNSGLRKRQRMEERKRRQESNSAAMLAC